MSEPSTPTPQRLYRQIVVRIPESDLGVLDRAVATHGSIQTAVLEALRHLDPPPAIRPGRSQPGDGDHDSAQRRAPTPPVPTRLAPSGAASALTRRPTVAAATSHRAKQERWVSLADLAMRIRLRPATLRHKAREQGALRGRGPTTQVNIDKLILDRHYAARLCGVTSATLRQRILAGKIPNINDALEVRLGDVYQP